MWELEGDFDSESESWDSAPQAPRSKETGAPQARGESSADLTGSVYMRDLKATAFRSGCVGWRFDSSHTWVLFGVS